MVHGPQGERSDNAAAKIIGTQAQRLADQAAVRSLDAIRRARGAIRRFVAKCCVGAPGSNGFIDFPWAESAKLPL